MYPVPQKNMSWPNLLSVPPLTSPGRIPCSSSLQQLSLVFCVCQYRHSSVKASRLYPMVRIYWLKLMFNNMALKQTNEPNI